MIVTWAADIFMPCRQKHVGAGLQHGQGRPDPPVHRGPEGLPRGGQHLRGRQEKVPRSALPVQAQGHPRLDQQVQAEERHREDGAGVCARQQLVCIEKQSTCQGALIYGTLYVCHNEK